MPQDVKNRWSGGYVWIQDISLVRGINFYPDNDPCLPKYSFFFIPRNIFKCTGTRSFFKKKVRDLPASDSEWASMTVSAIYTNTCHSRADFGFFLLTFGSHSRIPPYTCLFHAFSFPVYLSCSFCVCAEKHSYLLLPFSPSPRTGPMPYTFAIYSANPVMVRCGWCMLTLLTAGST